MLIDWLTVKLDERHLTEDVIRLFRSRADRIIRISAATGDPVYETTAWDSIRSDSHAISIRMCSDCLMICGSPARVIGDGDAVFGNGASAELDLHGCIDAMRRFVSKQTEILLPSPESFKLTRIDVTDNLMLDSQEHVLEALDILNRTDGGRYKVSNKAGNSIYWSSKSKRFKGKAYAKGEHLRYLMHLKTYRGKQYSIKQIEAATRLLRLELTIGSLTLHEIGHWSNLSKTDLLNYFTTYFSRMLGDSKMTDTTKLYDTLLEVCPTKGQANAAFDFFSFIKANGLRAAKRRYSQRTFTRHQANLRKAGLADADISTGEVVKLRQDIIRCRSVSSWEELMAACGD